jgi:hypothetical protein
MGRMGAARLARLHKVWESTLPDTCTPQLASTSFASGTPFACNLREGGAVTGGRLDFEAGTAMGYRLRVERAAPVMKSGDRVVVRGKRFQITRAYPAPSQAAAPSYGVKELP